MRPDDVALLALKNVRNRGLRSGLTVLGIMIGVAAVVSLISLGQGLGGAVTAQLEGLGGQVISITPGGSQAQTFNPEQVRDALEGRLGQSTANLTTGDARIVRGVVGVAAVNGVVATSAAVAHRAEFAQVSVQGVDPVPWARILTTGLDQGRLLVEGDGKVAVIGAAVANTVFSNPVAVNDIIRIGGHSFRVVGILKPASGFGFADQAIVVPVRALRDLVDAPQVDRLTSIVALAAEGQDVATVSQNIDRALLAYRHKTESSRDFTLVTSQQIAETVDTVLGSITVFLGAIATVSLLVGGIGIANTMFMAVLERSRQIGILKALGATNPAVAGLFMVESGALGLIGGVLGLAGGWGLGLAVSALGLQFGPPGASQVGLKLAITPLLAFGGVAFALVVGLLSGLLPALRAARLEPVETLRAE